MNDIDSSTKSHKRSARGERILKKQGPLLVENDKKVLVIKGHKTSAIINDLLKDLAKLFKPLSKVLSKKNDILPFEDINSLEFLSQKNDCSLFTLGSHTKKRPNNLIIGRMYDGHVLDMVELGVESYEGIDAFPGRTKGLGSKPLFTFLGDQWETDSTYIRVQNVLIDLFRGRKLDMLNLKGIDHVIGCSVIDGMIHLRVYIIQFKKSGSKVPLVDLMPMGPFITFSVRRTQLASDELYKVACKVPKITVETKTKNIKKNELGDKLGRIHMKKQNLDNMKVKRIKVLRNRNDDGDADGNSMDVDEMQGSAKKRKRS